MDVYIHLWNRHLLQSLKNQKKKWERFKNYKQESFESMINRILKSQAEEDTEFAHQGGYFRNRAIRQRHQKGQIQDIRANENKVRPVMVWTVIFTAKAERDLEKLPDDIAKRIILRIEEIAQDDPYQKLDKMTNSPYYKFRVGVYRGIVNMVNDKMILQLVKAKHRSNVYKK